MVKRSNQIPDEGVGWTSYQIVGRPLQSVRRMVDVQENELSILLERAANKFVLEHKPLYGRNDITDMVVFRENGRRVPQYNILVAFTKAKGEQV